MVMYTLSDARHAKRSSNESNWIFLRGMFHKSDTFDAFRSIYDEILLMSNELRLNDEYPVKILRSDNSGEFMSNQFKQHLNHLRTRTEHSFLMSINKRDELNAPSKPFAICLDLLW